MVAEAFALRAFLASVLSFLKDFFAVAGASKLF